uniref:probable E3 ubiquitin-protein ligase RHY1A n=1 Tax=Erigeron canadensis TaxID=72917 RepID=UPI001CB928E1|nr:probable E3 ubiquitin-protein ligase RHY1A [Erigeron canadensis]
MAGKIPGVESARRRRMFPGSTGWSDSSFAINSALGSTRGRGFYDTHFTTTSLSKRSMVNQLDEDEKLGGVARIAKQRLDGKLRSHYWKSQSNSIQNNQERSTGANRVEEVGRKPSSNIGTGDMQTEGYGLKKSSSKRFSWGKLGLNWKSSDQDECAVCLDKFKVGDKLERLPCAHRFHSVCLLPWLESNAHCPCCRMSVLMGSS